MKIIHSFWSKPAFKQEIHENSRICGGWINYKYFVMSNCFSCLTARRYHKSVELYSDSYGYNLFIETLKLPYTYATRLLDDLDSSDSRLWVLGKLKTISAQQQPFIHMDNDVYLWERLPTSNAANYKLAQNLVPLPETYRNTLKQIFKNFKYVPECLKVIPSAITTLANIGIIGGNDIDFFREYCSTAYSFLNSNLNDLEKINVGYFNQILDEYLFICLARYKKSPLTLHINDSYEKDPLQAVLRFNLVPFIDKYIHLVGFAKQNRFACEQLELRFKIEFPSYYNTVWKFIQENYPEYNNFTTEEVVRRNRIAKTLKRVYECNGVDILNKPLKLRENLVIETHKDEFDSSLKYFLRINDASGKVLSLEELKGTDELLINFTSSITINKLLEELEPESENYEQLKFKLTDIITEKLIIDDILELI